MVRPWLVGIVVTLTGTAAQAQSSPPAPAAAVGNAGRPAAELYAAALAAEKDGAAHPEAALKAWKAVAQSDAGEKERAYAVQRAEFWFSQKAEQTGRQDVQVGNGRYDSGISVSIEGQTCVTPCVFHLPSGRFNVVSTGSALPRAELIVSDSSEAPRIVPGHSAILVSGAIVGAVGLGLFATYATLACAGTIGGCGAGHPGETVLVTGSAFSGLFVATGLAELIAWGVLQDERLTIGPAGRPPRAQVDAPRFRFVALGAQPTSGGFVAGADFSF